MFLHAKFSVGRAFLSRTPTYVQKANPTKTDDPYRQVLMQGQRCMQQQQPAAAVPCFEQCGALQPTNGYAWSSLGQALLDVNRLPEALTVLDHAVRHAPNDVEAWYNHGLTQRRLGAFASALVSITQALRLNPRAWLAWYEKGVILVPQPTS